MYGTDLTPTDFRRLVKKVVESPVMAEARSLVNGRYYKVVYVFLYKNDETKTTLRLDYCGGDCKAKLLTDHQLHSRLPTWSVEEMEKLAQALLEAQTIVSAFYSAN